MRTEPTATYCPKLRRLVVDVMPGWTSFELEQRFRHDENGKPRGLAFRHRSAAHAIAA